MMIWVWTLSVIPLICDIGQIVTEVVRGNYPTAILFLGYTIAQIGAIWILTR